MKATTSKQQTFLIIFQHHHKQSYSPLRTAMRFYIREAALLSAWISSVKAANTVRGAATPTDEIIISPSYPLERELLYNSQCSTHPACIEAGKEGECCPNEVGFFSECCTRECSAYPVCVDEGKTGGDCCPSHDGDLLACCFPPDPSENPSASPSVTPTSSPTEIQGFFEQGSNERSCSAYKTCADIPLDGNCCENDFGLMLECCKTCESHPRCKAENREGRCCPTAQGEMLACCEFGPLASSANTPTSSPTEFQWFFEQGSNERSCSSYKTCTDIPLDGNCCENDFGLMLECCKTCESHPRCEAENREGRCCPTAQGEMLACCEFGPLASSAEPSSQPSAGPSGAPSSKPSGAPSSSPSASPSGAPSPDPEEGTFDRSCSAFKTCAEIPLAGNCCENDQGLMLDCCKTCESHPLCAHLADNCCPNDQGLMLDCCKF